ncbi:MAG: zinc metalloprotease HtpX [Nitrococcus sp.]|nr:zinc metalloprotease HtpX [Nitrococcus sp.]
MSKFKLSRSRILSQLDARPLSAHVAPGLNDLLDSLARRAGLPAAPTLYYVPSATMNAFAVGNRQASAVAITDAMLRAFSPREIAAVFAHEVSHLRINDLWVMASSNLCGRLARLLSTAGQALLLLNLSLLFSSYGVSWVAILILVCMPLISTLMHLTLARAREYKADLGAVELTGDVRGLVMALEKMERYHRRSLRRILRAQGRLSKLSLLRTHPLSERRIERLRGLDLVGSPPLRSHARATIWQAYPVIKRHAAFVPRNLLSRNLLCWSEASDEPRAASTGWRRRLVRVKSVPAGDCRCPDER